MTVMTSLPPFVEWDQHVAQMGWRQSEHVTIIGPTGQGKSNLALALTEHRKYVVVLATKPKDSTLRKAVRKRNFQITREWPPSVFQNRVIYWPLAPRDEPENTKEMEDAIRKMLRHVYTVGAWCVVIDELRHVTDFLKQKRMAELLWQQGRSLNVSVVANTQRPTHVPLLAYDQATHLYLYADQDETNIKRMGGLGYFSRGEIMNTITRLARHEVLYLNTREAQMYRTRLPETEVL